MINLELENSLAVLHLFVKIRTLDFAELDGLCSVVKAAQKSLKGMVVSATFGHRSDMCFMLLDSDPNELWSFQRSISMLRIESKYSYFSLTELSEYSDFLPDDIKNARLFPNLPPKGYQAFCFYPMSKKRLVGANWYELPYSSRRDLMKEHGYTGRKYAGKVIQLVTGSAGLDDYEWGVTLFGKTHEDLKNVVYEMRYDKASAKYGDFGPFISGIVLDDPISTFNTFVKSD